MRYHSRDACDDQQEQGLSMKLRTVICIFLIFSNLSFAQQNAGGAAPAGGGEGGNEFIQKSLSDLYIVLGAGAGGAILGLSTLSFVDEPSEHLKNIIVGGAIGIIVGVGVVAFRQATSSKQEYEELAHLVPTDGFSTYERDLWSREQIQKHEKKHAGALGLSFSF